MLFSELFSRRFSGLLESEPTCLRELRNRAAIFEQPNLFFCSLFSARCPVYAFVCRRSGGRFQLEVCSAGDFLLVELSLDHHIQTPFLDTKL